MRPTWRTGRPLDLALAGGMPKGQGDGIRLDLRLTDLTCLELHIRPWVSRDHSNCCRSLMRSEIHRDGCGWDLSFTNFADVQLQSVLRPSPAPPFQCCMCKFINLAGI